MLKAFLCRLTDDGRQTLGSLRVYDGTNKVFECLTLEPPWRDNKKSVSCIPAGTYRVTPRESPKYGQHFLINGTSPREWVLIHAGNFVRDTAGCICVGRSFGDIDRDGVTDLISSKVMLELMVQVIGDREFSLTIA